MNKRLKSKWALIYFFITGFFAFLWVFFRSGLNPKRLAYPCQQAAFPIASAWFLMLVTTFGGLAITKRLRKQSIATVAVIFISIFMVSSTKSFLSRAYVDLPVWKVDNPVSKVYAMNNIPRTIGTLKNGDASVPDASLVDPAIDTLLKIMTGGGLDFYNTTSTPNGIVESDDIVVIKGNFQWKSRLSTHTDRIKGVIWNILNHPNGFTGEILVCDNTNSSIAKIDEYRNNSDDVEQTIVDVVNTFKAKGYPVGIVEWSDWRGDWVGEYSDGDMTDGDVLNEDTQVSYPKFKSPGGAYISLSKGIWDTESQTYDENNLCIINFPVVKAHGMMGATLGIKNWVGVMSTSGFSRFGGYDPMHYNYFWSEYALISRVMEVTFPDLTIIDGTWTSTASNAAYTTSEMINTNCLIASTDPLAASWYAAKYILNPIAGSKVNSDPDNLDGTYGEALQHLTNYLINTAGLNVTKDPSKISIYDRTAINVVTGDINLTVNSGTGSGRYFEDEVISISPALVTGKEFSHWTGDTIYLTSPANVADNKVEIPSSDITLTAVYEDILYTLTVVNGTGSGTEYKYEEVVEITADEASEGYVFSQWTGDVDYVANVRDSVTNVTLPAKNITVTATYKEINDSTDNNDSSDGIPLFNWNMEAENIVLDEGSAKMDLTNYGSVTTGGIEPNPPGYGSVGAVFNGSGKYLSLSNSDYGNRALNGTDTDGTIYIAVNPDDVSSPYFWSKYTSSERQLAIGMYNGEPIFTWGHNDGSSYQDVEIPHTFSANDDIIIALSLDASTKEYTFLAWDVDADEYYSITESGEALSGTYNTGTSDMTIGGLTASSFLFNGTIYWIRIYDELHSEEKMKEIIENGNQPLNGITVRQSITQNELKVYPNPSKGTFTFDIEDIALADVYITDASGREINSEITINDDKAMVDISGNPNGLYIISIRTDDALISSKVLLQK